MNGVTNLCNQKQTGCVAGEEIGNGMSSFSLTVSDNHDCCVICLEKIELQEKALVKGCEHAHCVTCILRWASYNQTLLCPQCKSPFEFLNVHRSLDGSIHDYMFKESVCLLLRATWFYDEFGYNYQYEEEEEKEEEKEEEEFKLYYTVNSNGLPFGSVMRGLYYTVNSNGRPIGSVLRGGKEARPVHREFQNHVAGPSRGPKKKEAVKDPTGRRAKKALKAAVKHQRHLMRLGHKVKEKE